MQRNTNIFKGVIFDLDGTLVNSLEDIAGAMNHVLGKYGFPTHDLQAYKFFVGNGIENLVRQALPGEAREGDMVARCYDAMMEEYRCHCLVKTRPYAGIAELLDKLTALRVPLAVLSNKTDELTKQIVHSLFANYRFEIIMGARPNLPRKPNPTGALIISRQLGILPAELIYVGDSGVDMQTANEAGMYAVGALWGFRTREELLMNGAKHLLEDPMALIQLL